MPKSYSQNRQDLFVEKIYQGKEKGYFLEIGGGDGLWISNTLLLEEKYNWTGILVEPTKAFEKLIKNRPNCVCVNKCVSDTYRTLTLVEIHDQGQAKIDPQKASENTLLSQVFDENVDDLNTFEAKRRAAKEFYEVEAVPLQSILDQANAPKYIDYFSLDVEGHEETILIDFPFDIYSFGCLGIERPSQKLHEKLLSIGYKNVIRIGDDIMYLNQSKFNIVYR